MYVSRKMAPLRADQVKHIRHALPSTKSPHVRETITSRSLFMRIVYWLGVGSSFFGVIISECEARGQYSPSSALTLDVFQAYSC